MAIQYLATVLFACAVLHTFCSKAIRDLAQRFPEGSIAQNLLHFLGEIEVIFGLWAAVLITCQSALEGAPVAAHFLESVNYTEAVFVFVIMCMAATRPILNLAETSIYAIARLIPASQGMSLYAACLILGPLLGSFITEPAAMTVTAILLRDAFFGSQTSRRFKYATLGLLFVNISIGGTLTHFAAPPVLMVAGPWQWDSVFMASHFGWRAALAIIVGSLATAFAFRRELQPLRLQKLENKAIPRWVTLVHLLFMALTIFNAHYIVFVIPLFLFFLGWFAVARAYQEELRLRESMLVGFFLAGLVTLGNLQAWWLQPLLSQMGDQPLFWGALALTALTDNAALTFLGTLVPNFSDGAKYSLVAGAVAGGGLTVIANAPNPAGYGLLRDSFGEDGISPLGLFLAALPFTLLAALAFLM